MIEFIPARILKKDFDIFGHFYSVTLRSGDKIDCRSVLEIVTKKRKKKWDRLNIKTSARCNIYHDESGVIHPPRTDQ